MSGTATAVNKKRYLNKSHWSYSYYSACWLLFLGKDPLLAVKISPKGQGAGMRFKKKKRCDAISSSFSVQNESSSSSRGESHSHAYELLSIRRSGPTRMVVGEMSGALLESTLIVIVEGHESDYNSL